MLTDADISALPSGIDDFVDDLGRVRLHHDLHLDLQRRHQQPQHDIHVDLQHGTRNCRAYCAAHYCCTWRS